MELIPAAVLPQQAARTATAAISTHQVPVLTLAATLTPAEEAAVEATSTPAAAAASTPAMAAAPSTPPEVEPLS